MEQLDDFQLVNGLYLPDGWDKNDNGGDADVPADEECYAWIYPPDVMNECGCPACDEDDDDGLD